MEKFLLYIPFTLLGLIIGIFFSNFYLKKRFQFRIGLLNKKILEKESCLSDLENECKVKKRQLDKIIMDSIYCKAELLKLSNDFRRKSDELYRLQNRLNSIKSRISKVEEVERRNRILLSKVNRLERREEELKKSNLENEIRRLKEIISKRDSELEALRKREKLEKEKYIKISKDQFYQIENRLKEYKEKIDSSIKQEKNLIESKPFISFLRA